MSSSGSADAAPAAPDTSTDTSAGTDTAAPAAPAAQPFQADSFSAGPATGVGQRDQGDTFQVASATNKTDMPTLADVQKGKDAVAAEAREVAEAQAREKATDGQFVGPNGISPSKDTAGAFKPADGKLVSDKPVYFVNGINTTAAEHAEAAQALADKLRRPVYAVHNATDGALQDVGQSVRQKLLGTDTPPTNTLAREIKGALDKGQSIDIYGHSQGAIDVSNAINATSRDLYKQGLSTQQVQQRLGGITAHTFGGAAQMYADGPQYVHHINEHDQVASNFGLGGLPNGFQHPGRGAVIDRQWQPGPSHAFKGYLNWAVPQAQVN